jgi:RNA polymerase sigma-70 factor (ECF subfamily)
MCRYALSYLENAHLAEDVVQETFVKFWEQKKELSHSPEAKFYLVTAVRNNCISALRRQNATGVQLVEDTPDTHSDILITPRQLREDATERQQKISEALSQLPPKCKEVFLLIKLHGMSYQQAANALDLSVKTIENQMGKAIKTLREYVKSAVVLILMLLIAKKYV